MKAIPRTIAMILVSTAIGITAESQHSEEKHGDSWAEGLGVCRVGANSTDCWNMEGKPDAGLTSEASDWFGWRNMRSGPKVAEKTRFLVTKSFGNVSLLVHDNKYHLPITFQRPDGSNLMFWSTTEGSSMRASFDKKEPLRLPLHLGGIGSNLRLKLRVGVIAALDEASEPDRLRKLHVRWRVTLATSGDELGFTGSQVKAFRRGEPVLLLDSKGFPAKPENALMNMSILPPDDPQEISRQRGIPENSYVQPFAQLAGIGVLGAQTLITNINPASGTMIQFLQDQWTSEELGPFPSVGDR